MCVFVLLPPSETKSDGGSLGPLELDKLAMPQLTAIRDTLVTVLVELAADPEASRTALGLGKGHLGKRSGGTEPFAGGNREESHTAGSRGRWHTSIARNAALRTAPTCPALDRYTGILYHALDTASFTKAQQEKAYTRLGIGSALFGVVWAGDPIPAYRLSGGSTLPGLPSLAALWKPELASALRAETAGELVVDLRSGTYQQLGRIPGAVTASVSTERPDGTRAVASHVNKHHKGLLARALVRTRSEPTDIDALGRIAEKAGLRIEIASPTELLVLT